MSEAVDVRFVDPLLTLIEDAAGLQWKRSIVPFARMLQSVELGEAIGFGISPDNSRQDRLLFSRPVFAGAVWAVSRRVRNIDVVRAVDLRGLAVCQSRQAAYGGELAAAKDLALDLRQVAGDLSHRMATLRAGHCDVLLVTSRKASVDSLHERLRAAGADVAALRVSRKPLVKQEVQFAVAKSSAFARHLPAIDAAIRSHHGEIARLVDE
jgi:hypothetical protein